VVFVPELLDPMIGESGKRASGGRSPISWQNRLPDREHPNLRFRMLFEQSLDCGGPPQTHRSGRRKQKDDAQAVSRLVEFLFERVQRSTGQIAQRRLSWRGGVTSKINSHTQSQSDRANHDQEDSHGLPHRDRATESHLRTGPP
jgi:hypothetical protein